MPIVYILQEAPGRNLTPALKFGKIQVLMNPGDVSLKSEVTYDFLYKALKEFTREDYVVLMGAPRAIAAVGVVLNQISGGDYGVLNWDRQCGEYIPSRMIDPKYSAHKGESNEWRPGRYVPGSAGE